MTRKILVADLLCGAGGSSTGCARALAALGLEMELVCVNHWPVAIDTHTRNHPHARHYVQDIATVRPHLIVPELRLDLLMASPTCTHHSVARGGKPTSDQQRSDPWHINTWLTELDVARFIIENVWEFIGWGPVDPKTGKPIASRKGEYFRAWTDSLRATGYQLEWRKLNAANYGDATTRQRFIMKGRKDRKTIVWAPITHAKKTDDLLLLPSLKPWRPARDIIDWSIKGKSIFARKKPLAPKTLARIHAGAVKFGWPEPFLVILRNHMAGQSVDGPVPTIAANGQHIGLAEPVIMNGRKGNQAKPVSTDPVPTLDTKGGVWLAEPFVLSQQNSGQPRSASEPLPTITTGGAGTNDHPGCARPMLVEPFVLNRHGDNGGTRAHSTGEPLPPSDCRGAGYVIEPFILSRQANGAPRSTDEPMCTQTAQHSPVLITSYYGASAGAQSDEEPLPTVTTKDRFGIVVPVTHTSGGNGSRDIDQPIPTITTAKGGELAIVMPVTHAGGHDRAQSDGDPLPTITGTNRGELAFITAQHGEREGQAPRVHSIDNPAPTIAASGHVDLVIAEAVTDGARYDILFRMLEPHELAAAMGFNSGDAIYEFAGTKTEQIKQIGNAVSVAMMKAEVMAIMRDAAPRKKPAAHAPGRSAAA